MRPWALGGVLAFLAVSAGMPPRRIISMSPSATEILYGLGVLDRVVAVSDYDTWPPQVKKLPHIGGWSTPNLERVSAFRPDLVVLSDAQNGLIGEQLRRFGVTVAVLPTQTLADVFAAISTAGQATGREAEAQRLLADTQAKLEAIRRRTRALPHPTVLCVVDRTPGALRNIYVAGSNSFLRELIQIAGGRLAAPEARGGYARLSDEQLLGLNPDVIIDIMQASPDRLGDDPEAVWRAFPELKALRNHRIVLMHEDYVTHASQRVAQTAALLAKIVHPEAGF
jgi:iron complex transport system substrate-binding protein